MLRLILATLLTTALTTVAVAQSDVSRAAGAEFSDFKTYWAEKREGCQPMISFKIKNISSEDTGPIEFRMEVADEDNKTAFAHGAASIPSGDLGPSHTRDIAIGGDHDITALDCLGDMHQMAFSTIHFAVRLTATVGRGSASVEILRDEPMKEERVRVQN